LECLYVVQVAGGPAEMQPPVQVEEFTVQGTAGEPIQLPIAAGPATGYVWQLEMPTGVHRIGDGPERQVDPKSALGAASGGRLQVTAQAGDYVVSARLARPWQGDLPVRIVRIRLHVEQ